MKLTMLAGAAAIAALIATPAVTPALAKSQEKISGPQKHAMSETRIHKTRTMQVTKADKMQARQMRDSQASIQPRGSGFPPLDFAAGVAGGAVSTAGAIASGAVNTAGAVATAPFTPFRGDSYAYYRDTSTMPNRGYIADTNGPKCMPGQVTTINGHKMTCQ